MQRGRQGRRQPNRRVATVCNDLSSSFFAPLPATTAPLPPLTCRAYLVASAVLLLVILLDTVSAPPSSPFFPHFPLVCLWNSLRFCFSVLRAKCCKSKVERRDTSNPCPANPLFPSHFPPQGLKAASNCNMNRGEGS